MEWLSANWFWFLIAFAFVAMHLFGHGGHSGHGGTDSQRGNDEKDNSRGRVVDTTLGKHQH